MKLIAAMSGGVDSAVAAARAVEEGHDVIGGIWRFLVTHRSIARVREGAALSKIHMMPAVLQMS